MTVCFPLAFLGGSPGPMELIVIFLLILVLFGPRRLPEIAKMIGKTLHELRRASEDFKQQIMSIDTEEGGGPPPKVVVGIDPAAEADETPVELRVTEAPTSIDDVPSDGGEQENSEGPHDVAG